MQKKKMTCRELGGGCDMVFEASTFDEISQLSRVHGMEMFQKGDPAHMEAMQKMRDIMQTPDGLQKWMDEKMRLFNER